MVYQNEKEYPHIEYKMKFDKFTIFLLLLGLLVIISLVMNFRSLRPLESFVNFQNQPAAGTAVYIPQYSANSTHTVTSLYDNMYFDSKNGSLLEVFAPACASGCDTTGKNITYLSIASRDARGITAMPTFLDANGNIKPYDSPQSKNTTLEPLYNQYVYTTSCMNTNIYQVIYVSWNKDTYLHIIDLSASLTTGTNVKTIHMNANGFVDAQSTFTPTTLQPYSSPVSTFVPNAAGSLSTTSVSGYGASLLQLGKDSTNNDVYYDVANGHIVLKNGSTFNVYNRVGYTVHNLQQPSTPWNSITKTNTFTINDTPGLSIIVSAHNNDTVINMLIPVGNKYKLIYTYRFNKTGIVLSAANDSDRNGPAPTVAASGSGSVPGATTPAGSIDISGSSNVCGDDLSCKWYWYFNTIAQKNGNGDTYFSDDYFLKTEAVPPVCPQCPQCPSAGGVCNNCGGSGGCGTAITTAPATSDPVCTQCPQCPSAGGVCNNCGGSGGCGTAITTAPATSAPGLPAGAIKDNSGNVYIPTTDSSGNVRYKLFSDQSAANASTTLYYIPTGVKCPPGAVAIKGDGMGNFTFVDKEGKFLSTADPNTFGGVASLTVLFAGSIANNLLSTTSDLAKDTATGAVGLAKDTVGGAVGLAKDTVGGAVGLAKDTVGGAVGLAKDTVGGAVGLLKDVGSGITGLGRGLDVRSDIQGQNGVITVNNNVASTGSSLGYTPIGSKTIGSVPGQTQIDNYSYYGALQSKGGNYMPVTADFSAFRK